MSDASWGITDPEWLIKAVIANADSRMLKISVIQLIDWIHKAPNGFTFTALEVVERLVQVAVQGKYFPTDNSSYTMTFENGQDLADYVGSDKFNEDLKKLLGEDDNDEESE